MQYTAADFIGVCHNCAHRVKSGPFRIDCSKTGKNIADQVADGCPAGYFNSTGLIAIEKPSHPAHSIYQSLIVRNRQLWAEAHRRPLKLVDAATELDWINNTLLPQISCGDCRTDFAAYLQSHPPDLSSPRNYFLWTVAAHNAVNRRLSKPELTPAHAARIHGLANLMTPEELALDTAPVRLLIRIDYSLGDSVCLTGAIHDLLNAFPGEYEVSVETNFPQVFENLPVQCATPPTFDLACSIHNSYKWGENFSQFYNRQLSEAINRPIAQGPFRPWLLLSDAEWDAPPLVRGPYWVIFPGGKLDCLTKVWPGDSWNRLANVALVRFVAVGGSGSDHVRPKLGNQIIDMVGQTSIRQLIQLIASPNCLGVVCGVTAGVHLAAAFGKPCVVIAGARERPAPARYDGHQYLETPMPCAGCWKLRVLPFAESFHAYSR